MPIVESAREDARLEPYLTRREKLLRSAAMLPMFALGIVLTGVHGFGPPVSGLYLLLGALVWLLATTWLVAAVTVRLRRRARERRRNAVRARRRRAGRRAQPALTSSVLGTGHTTAAITRTAPATPAHS